MLFLFNLCYAATWGTVAFLIPTEIFPSEMRAQGNGFGITGWAIGVGWTVLVNPIMFGTLAVSILQLMRITKVPPSSYQRSNFPTQNRTYFLFAGLNLLWIPIVYLIYPETAGRSLESIEVMFSTKSPLNRAMERAYTENGNIIKTHGGRENVVRRLSIRSQPYQKSHGDFSKEESSEASV